MTTDPAAQHAIRDQLDSGYPAIDRIRKANAELRAALAPEGCSHRGHAGEYSARPVLTAERITWRDRSLVEYLDAMDEAGGGIYTADFRDGFRHALAMLAAFETDAGRTPDQVTPEVREAARLALARRTTSSAAGEADR
jgi:hypothetical protein